jgi:hypothetical protein
VLKRAATVSFKVKLSASAAKRLQRTGKARVTVTFNYRTFDGRSQVRKAKVTVKRIKAKKATAKATANVKR